MYMIKKILFTFLFFIPLVLFSQDLNNDGVVDNTDRILFRQYLKSQNLDADFNGDGKVDMTDMYVVTRYILDSPNISLSSVSGGDIILTANNINTNMTTSIRIEYDASDYQDRESGTLLEEVSPTLSTYSNTYTDISSGLQYVTVFLYDKKVGWLKGIKDTLTVLSATPAYSIDTIYVDTDASGAGDGTSWTDAYTGLNAALQAEETDLTTANKKLVFSCRASSGTADGTAASVDADWTTNDSCYVEVGCYGDNRHAGVWDSTKYRIETDSYTCLSVGTEYAKINGIQIYQISTSQDRHGLLTMPSGTGVIEVCNNIVKGSNPTTNIHYAIRSTLMSSGSVVKVYNNIVYDVGSGTSSVSAISRQSSNITGYYYNNTVYNCNIGYATADDGGSFIAKNNIAQNCADGFSTGWSWGTGTDYNISDIASDAPGTNSFQGTVAFVDTTNDNFLLSPYDTVAQQAGVELYDDTNIAITTSIEGNSRGTASAPNFDIGASHPLTMTRIVDTDGTSGHYATLSAWESDLDQDLTAIAKIMKADCRATTGLKDSTWVRIYGWVTSSDYYIEIGSYGSYRHAGVWDSTLYVLNYDQISNDHSPIYNLESNVRIDGLQIYNTNSTIQPGIAIWNYGTDNCYVSNCILRRNMSSSGGTSGIAFEPDTVGSDITNYAYNNIIYDHPNSGVQTYVGASRSSTVYVYNNTFLNLGTGVYSGGPGTIDILAVNNITQECTDGYNATFNGSSDYNISDIASDAPGTNSFQGTVAFVDTTNDNFLLSANDTVAIDAGTDLSSDSYLPFSTDIQGNARVPKVLRVGTIYEWDATDSFSESITIPDNAELAVLAIAGRVSGGGGLPTFTVDPNINGESFTLKSSSSPYEATAVWILENPSTGSQTLAWTGSLTDPPHAYLVFYDNINSDSSVYAVADTNIDGSPSTQTLTITPDYNGYNDMYFGITYDWDHTPDFDQNNQTHLADREGDGVDEESGIGQKTLSTEDPDFAVTSAYARFSAITILGESWDIGASEYLLPECEDYDGNTYTVVRIGDLYWTTTNLRTTHYSNGVAIDTAATNDSWTNKTEGAYCWYGDDSSTYAAAYGALYNWHAVDSLLAPTGWRIPTDDDFDSLEAYLGMTEAQTDSTDWRGDPVGTYLKGARDATGGDGHPRWGADGGGIDSVSWIGYPGGTRNGGTGAFILVGDNGYWWSTTEYNSTNGWFRQLRFSSSEVYRLYFDKESGFSVRCVRDVD